MDRSAGWRVNEPLTKANSTYRVLFEAAKASSIIAALDDMTRASGTRPPRGAALTMTERNPDHVEEAAKVLAKWIGYAWDGLHEERIGNRGFSQWSFNGIGHKQFQGGKQDLRDLAEKIAALANGELRKVGE